MTIEESFDYFIDYIKSYCSNDTILYYKNCLHIFDMYLKDINVCSYSDISFFSRKIVIDYILYLRGKNITNTSIRTYFRGFRSYIRHLYFEHFIECDYTQHLKLPKADNKKQVPLSSTQVQILDNFLLSENRYRDFCIVHIMVDCGLRLQEVINLKKADLKKDFIIVRSSKNNSSRIVPLPYSLYLYIEDYIGLCPTSIYVFQNRLGNRLSSSGLKSMFTKLKNIVPNIHSHLLRHTFATSFIMGGGNLENLRVLMGHSTYSVTQNYIYFASELSLVNYDIYKIDDVFFNSFSYRKRLDF